MSLCKTCAYETADEGQPICHTRLTLDSIESLANEIIRDDMHPVIEVFVETTVTNCRAYRERELEVEYTPLTLVRGGKPDEPS